VTSHACCDLISDRRLCLTGTPLQNKVDDIFALIKFLRLSPFDEKATWTQLIGVPIKYNQPIGLKRLQTIMKILALRRTKETKGPDGMPILSLPSRTDRMVLLKLQKEEQTVYDSFFGELQAEFMNMAKADVMKNYVNILQKMSCLRQICDDVQLITASEDGARYGCAAQYEETLNATEKDGINLERATAIFALLRETSTAQCAECGMELASLLTDGGPDIPVEGEDTPVNGKGSGRWEMKSSMAVTRASSPSPSLHPIITRCTHLFCLHCFRSKVSADWPHTPPELMRNAQCVNWRLYQREMQSKFDLVDRIWGRGKRPMRFMGRKSSAFEKGPS
jgi:SWI/SNF-related matrix-associated actin-dependent regulator of chromatin subfamily A3